MDTDLLLVAGLVLAWLGVPAFFSAYAHRRSPVMAAALRVLGGAALHGQCSPTPEGIASLRCRMYFSGFWGAFSDQNLLPFITS